MSPKLTDSGRGTGAIRDLKDKRDFHFKEIAYALPPVDWTIAYDVEQELKVILPVKDQGASGSCGGQAWANYGNALTAFFDKKLEDRSAKFIYAQTFAPGGGSAGRDNSNVVTKQGWAHESLLPSLERGMPPSEEFMEKVSDITPPVREDARHDRALSYAQVDTDIDSVAQAIRANHGVVIGITGQNNGTWLTTFPAPPKDSTDNWDHWVYAGKYRMMNGEKFIGILNSWGNIGIGGWQWISETYFNTIIAGQNVVWSAWTLVFNQDKIDPFFEHNFSVDMNLGDVSNDVRALQTCLQANGQYPKSVPITGNYGEITRQSVLKFQQKYVSPDGIWNAFIVWWSQGKNVAKPTRDKLNMLFAPII